MGSPRRFLAITIGMAIICSPISGIYIKHYSTVDESLAKHFPDATTVSSQNIEISGDIKSKIENFLGVAIRNKSAEIYVLERDNEIAGYGIVLDELGKYEPITLITSINPDNTVKDIAILTYREKIGSSVRKRRYLKQYFGKSLDDPLALHKDIDGITGATVSSWSVTTAVKKSLLIVEDLKQNEILL